MKSYKILFLEDDKSSFSYVINMLTQNNFIVTHVTSYKEAMLEYNKLTYNLILTDIEPKKESGIDFIKNIRKENDNIHIIITSSHANKNYLINLINLGVTKYFVKPIKSEELLNCINDCIKDESKIYYFEKNFEYSALEKNFKNQNGDIIRLNTQEINLVEYLLKNNTKYNSYNELQNIIGKEIPISIDALRTLVKSFRKKTYSDIIINLSGVGYKINYDNTSEVTILNDKINILVVDDQKVNLYFLKILIDKYIENVNIFFASNGKKAIDILKTTKIDIALLDIHMPDISGWDIAKFIQEELKTSNMAIVFITSIYHEEEFEKRGYELGAVDYIIKPINQNQFINRLKLYIRNFLNEKRIFNEIEKNKQKDKLILQQEVSLAQTDILEKIAHHWRQPLSIISLSAGLINTYLDMDIYNKEEVVKSCQDIVSTTNNLSSTIDQFIKFFKSENIKTLFNLKDAIDDTIKIMSINFNENNIKLRLKLEDIEFNGFENEFKQILITILNNSLEILVDKQSLEFRFIEITLVQIDDKIEVSIIDNGGGVKNEIEDKIYQPYFTTKHEYSGTGISLYLANELIHRYFNGSLTNQNIQYEIESKNYKCANFKLNFKNIKGIE